MWITITTLVTYIAVRITVLCYVVTVPKVTIWLPNNVAPPVAVYQVFVSSSPTTLPEEKPLFRLQNPSPFFAVDLNDGTVRVNSSLAKFPRGKNKRNVQLVVNVFSSGSKSFAESNALSKAEIVVTVSSIDCSAPAQQWCFWPSSGSETAFLYENRPAFSSFAMAGPALAVRHSCPSWVLDYHIIQGSEYSTISREGVLKTLHPLDREKTPTLPVKLSCSIETDDGSRSTFSQNITLIMLDENDNGPQLQSSQATVPLIYLNDKTLQEGHVLKIPDSFLILDEDSAAVNNYHFDLLQSDGIFKLDHQIWELDSKGSTVIYVKPVVAASKLSWETPYNLTITVKDVGLIPTGKNDTVAFTVLVFKGNPPKTSTSRPAMGLQFVQVMNATVNKWACKYARINALLWDLSDNAEEYVAEGKVAEFTLVTDAERTVNPFSITPQHGILYVSNPEYLQSQNIDSYTLEIAWETRHDRLIVRNSSLLHVYVTEDSPPQRCHDEAFCAEARTEHDCLSSVGSIATLQSTCSWRSTVSNISTTLLGPYSTCSPNLKTCPDGTCDELEETHWTICPQDCIERSNLRGTIKFNDESPRGIKLASGVCSCDATKTCSCGPQLSVYDFAESGETEENKLLLANRTQNVQEDYVESCDTTCRIVVATLTTSFLLFPCTVILLWWRKRWSKCKSKERFVSGAGRAISVSDYVEERLPTTEADYLRGSELIAALMIVDRKWEIPREWLVIEQTLGEGEFGKVMRARVSSVTGISGHRVVAVKMTKTANLNSERDLSVELQDLLSEFSLLRDVCHPHVIRLLGACTSPGGPFMLVLEYCEHGSLRNYLRRTRCLDLDMQSAHRQCTISPREILSFAWQIAQAMAYLSEMKLVHRDLATRNVLVAADKMCKVSDFGLTRDVYEGDTYLKRSKGRVPVKWMAPESLSDQVYTSKSDVWSFGILLWELSTLGANPYPGVTPERLYRLLKSGYRMEKPSNCSTELYEVMMQCWKDDPLQRPTFSQLVDELDGMLSAGTDYLDLNSLIVFNREYFENTDGGERWDNDDQQPMLEYASDRADEFSMEKFKQVFNTDEPETRSSNQEEELRYLNMKPLTKPELKKEVLFDKDYLLPMKSDATASILSV